MDETWRRLPTQRLPRSTIDVDVIADLKDQHVTALVAALQRNFYLDETALRRAVANQSSANLIHHATSIKIDLFIAGGTPLDLQQIARRRRVEIIPAAGPPSFLFDFYTLNLNSSTSPSLTMYSLPSMR